MYVCHSSAHRMTLNVRHHRSAREKKRTKSSEHELESVRANETELRFRLVRNRSSAPFITVETENSDFPLVLREVNVAKGLETINRRVLVCTISDLPVATAYCRTERRSFSSSFSFPLSSFLLLAFSFAVVCVINAINVFQQPHSTFHSPRIFHRSCVLFFFLFSIPSLVQITHNDQTRAHCITHNVWQTYEVRSLASMHVFVDSLMHWRVLGWRIWLIQRWLRPRIYINAKKMP